MEIKNIISVYLAGFCAIIWVANVNGQNAGKDTTSFSTPLYSISGHLSFCKTDSVVRTATVSMVDATNTVVQQVYSDDAGFYQLSLVKGGNYTITFEWSGESAALPVQLNSDISGKDACLPVPVPPGPSIDATRAGTDIKNGIVQLYICDPGAPVTQSKLDQVTQKYGFHFIMKGKCLPTGADAQAFNTYNNDVLKYLDTVNKSGWHETLNAELQAMLQSLSPSVDGGAEFFMN